MTRETFGGRVEYAESAEDCLRRCSVCVLTYRSKAFRQAVESFVPARPLSIVVGWRMVDPTKLHTDIRWIALGRHPV